MRCSLFIHCKHTHMHLFFFFFLVFLYYGIMHIFVSVNECSCGLSSQSLYLRASVYQGLYREAYSLVQPSVDDRVCLHSHRLEASREEGSVGKIITSRL